MDFSHIVLRPGIITMKISNKDVRERRVNVEANVHENPPVMYSPSVKSFPG